MPIGLITDFGAKDWRLPNLKGTIYTTFPNARVIDISHEVPTFDIETGAFLLYVSSKAFPEEMVFVSVIDPGSSSKRYLVLTTSKEQIFVLPDNGLLTYIIQDTTIKSLYEITNEELFTQPVEELSTHQILGKIGALVASGYSPEDVGASVSDPVTLEVQEASITDNRLAGAVIFIDDYGNCLTNISRDQISEFGLQQGDMVNIETSKGTVEVMFGSTYGDVSTGDPVVFINRLGFLQLSLNMDDFSEVYNIQIGTDIHIQD
ncbi:S-adenosyl-l-methionine hydroxide adenosyltransferase family protein [Chloroflexota bacterium]